MARKKRRGRPRKPRLKLPPELSHWRILSEKEIISGGPEIGRFLGVDQRTVYNWRKLGLPVKFYAGRLYALKFMLVSWVRCWRTVRSPGPKVVCPYCHKKFNP